LRINESDSNRCTTIFEQLPRIKISFIFFVVTTPNIFPDFSKSQNKRKTIPYLSVNMMQTNVP